MYKVCNQCGKKVPKRYIEAHDQYEERKAEEARGKQTK